MTEEKWSLRMGLLTVLVYLLPHLISETDKLLSSHSGCTKGKGKEE